MVLCVCVETTKDNHVHRLEVIQVILSVSCLCFYRSSTGSRPSPASTPTDSPPAPPALIKDGISSAAFAGSEAACHSSLSTFCAAQGWVEVIGIREGSKRRDISVHSGRANFPGVRLIFFSGRVYCRLFKYRNGSALVFQVTAHIAKIKGDR